MPANDLPSSSTIVLTAGGAVRGIEVDGGILNFRGIPYAAPPVGALRFQPPEPHERWDGERDGSAFGPTAPQAGGGPLADVLPNVVIPGDDFLNLNVWTPGLDGRIPVMVFIHGGAFTSGSGAVSIYDGTRFARDGVVLVTINYRLGVDGFLWFGDGVPNLGMLDQVAALEWVRDNIAAFGGDPDDVTIFGESAGGMSVCTLMAMPAARGLFHRAIAESGAGNSVISPESARLIGTRLAELLGVEPTREAIGAVPIDRVVAAVGALGTEVSTKPRKKLWGDVARNLMPFEPVVDGTVLPGIPERVIAAGASHDVDLIIGTNSDEARLFFVPVGAMAGMKSAVAYFFAFAYGARPLRAVRRMQRLHPGYGPGERAAAILTEGFYRAPALRLAAVHPRSYVYEFAWGSAAFDGMLGACHALEIAFVFDVLDDPLGAPLLGGPAPQSVADAMHSAWVAFAKTGDPGWKPYSAEAPVSMRFDEVSGVLTEELRDFESAWPTR